MRSVTLKPPAMEGISKYHATNEDMLNEQVLVEAARKDPEQFKGLYNKYYERIYLFVFFAAPGNAVAPPVVYKSPCEVAFANVCQHR